MTADAPPFAAPPAIPAGRRPYLGPYAGLSEGQRMVWAVEFVRRLGEGRTGPEAANLAAITVDRMEPILDSTLLDPPARRMLESMLAGARR